MLPARTVLQDRRFSGRAVARRSWGRGSWPSRRKSRSWGRPLWRVRTVPRMGAGAGCAGAAGPGPRGPRDRSWRSWRSWGRPALSVLTALSQNPHFHSPSGGWSSGPSVLAVLAVLTVLTVLRTVGPQDGPGTVLGPSWGPSCRSYQNALVCLFSLKLRPIWAWRSWRS